MPRLGLTRNYRAASIPWNVSRHERPGRSSLLHGSMPTEIRALQPMEENEGLVEDHDRVGSLQPHVPASRAQRKVKC